MNDLFFIPVLDNYLFYAPLFRYARVVGRPFVEHYQESFRNKKLKTKRDLIRHCPQLKYCKKEKIRKLSGSVTLPLFLGLITTRGCNMGCLYCDFPAPKSTSPAMTVELAQKSVDMYLYIISNSGIKRGQIEFFGGEPFFKNKIAEFVLSYGQHKSAQMGIELQFKVTTNGIMSREKCAWAADNFDSVVLSLDGQAMHQNANRPSINGADSFEIVSRSAHILSSGNADLIIRSCITDSSVSEMPDIASWFAQEFVMSSICFESLSPSEFSRNNLLMSPDPYKFARNYLLAQNILDASDIELMTSGTDIDVIQSSFCPVGKDALIVTPEGYINACYLVEKEWEELGFDLRIGKILQNPPYFLMDQNQVRYARSLNVLSYPLCQNCFAKYHCAGGCHVNHSQIQQATSYDRLCIQTRLIIIGKLLKRIRSNQLYDEWLKTIEDGKESEYQIS
jgi:uncharacterized protein